MSVVTQQSISISDLKPNDYVTVPGKFINQKGTYYCTVLDVQMMVEDCQAWYRVSFPTHGFTGWLPDSVCFEIPPEQPKSIKDGREWKIPAYGSKGKRIRGVSVD